MDAIVETVRHIEIAAAVHGERGRSVKLPIAAAHGTKLAEIATAAVKFLDAVVVGIGHIEIPAAIGRHTDRRVNRHKATPLRTPLVAIRGRRFDGAGRGQHTTLTQPEQHAAE